MTPDFKTAPDNKSAQHGRGARCKHTYLIVLLFLLFIWSVMITVHIGLLWGWIHDLYVITGGILGNIDGIQENLEGILELLQKLSTT